MTRVGAGVVGGLLVLAGVALLVLPGPGLLLVLAGVLVLAQAFPAARRYVDPLRRRAFEAAGQSVATRARLVLSALTGVVLIVVGVLAGTVPRFPFGGWATGSSLIVSGLALLVLLAYSYARLRRRPTRTARTPR